MKNFQCSCGCGLKVDDEVVKIAEYLESKLLEAGLGKLVITSGARCEAHNKKIGGARNSAHTLGKALDIATPSSSVRFNVLKSLFDLGIERIGWNRDRKFIHFDKCNAKTLLPDKSGFYVSKIAFDY